MAVNIDNERFRKLLQAYPAKAIEILYNLLGKSLLNLAKKWINDQEAAEDIVQETFLYVWKNSQRLAQYHDQSIEHYLVKIVKNKSITFYTQSKKLEVERMKWIGDQFSSIPENGMESKLIETEIIREIRQVIATFPKRERQCLLMKIDDELTTAQIASTLEVSPKAVERSLTSARKRLRKHWADKDTRRPLL